MASVYALVVFLSVLSQTFLIGSTQDEEAPNVVLKVLSESAEDDECQCSTTTSSPNCQPASSSDLDKAYRGLADALVELLKMVGRGGNGCQCSGCGSTTTPNPPTTTGCPCSASTTTPTTTSTTTSTTTTRSTTTPSTTTTSTTPTTTTTPSTTTTRSTTTPSTTTTTTTRSTTTTTPPTTTTTTTTRNPTTTVSTPPATPVCNNCQLNLQLFNSSTDFPDSRPGYSWVGYSVLEGCQIANYSQLVPADPSLRPYDILEIVGYVDGLNYVLRTPLGDDELWGENVYPHVYNCIDGGWSDPDLGVARPVRALSFFFAPAK